MPIKIMTAMEKRRQRDRFILGLPTKRSPRDFGCRSITRATVRMHKMIDLGRTSFRQRMINLEKPRLHDLTQEESVWLFLARLDPFLDGDDIKILNFLTPVQNRKRRFGAA